MSYNNHKQTSIIPSKDINKCNSNTNLFRNVNANSVLQSVDRNQRCMSGWSVFGKLYQSTSELKKLLHLTHKRLFSEDIDYRNNNNNNFKKSENTFRSSIQTSKHFKDIFGVSDMNSSKTLELFVDKINKNSNQRVLQYQKILSSISKQLPKEDDLELYKNNKQINNEKERRLNRTPSCSKRSDYVSHKVKSVKKINNNNQNCSKDSLKNNSVSKLTTMKNSKNSSVLASAKKLKQCKSYVMPSKTSIKSDMNKLNLKSNSKPKTNTENNRYNKNRINYSIEENKRKGKIELAQSKNKENNIKINNTNELQNQQDSLNIKENEHKVVEVENKKEIIINNNENNKIQKVRANIKIKEKENNNEEYQNSSPIETCSVFNYIEEKNSQEEEYPVIKYLSNKITTFSDLQKALCLGNSLGSSESQEQIAFKKHTSSSNQINCNTVSTKANGVLTNAKKTDNIFNKRMISIEKTEGSSITNEKKTCGCNILKHVFSNH